MEVVQVELWQGERMGLLDRLAEADRAANQGEFRRVLRMLDFAEAARVEADSHENERKRQVARQALLDDLAVALGWSLNRVRTVVSEAQTVRHLAPQCWFAWARGDIGSAAIREMASALSRLCRASSAEALDAAAVAWLPGRRPGEVRAWLAQRVHRLEPEEFAEERERVEADREVRVTHRGDGMSELWALLPTRHAAAIAKNLRRVRASKPAADERTKSQWEADHVVDQLLCDPVTGEGVHMTLGVLIPVTSLAGVSEQPGVSVDGAWDLPADLVRDGTCCFPGCCVPAEFCDTDHLVPYDQGGPTAASNAKKWCRRHHKMKGFGLLPTPRNGPPDRPTHPVRRQIAAAFAGRTQEIDLEPLPIPYEAFRWNPPQRIRL